MSGWYTFSGRPFFCLCQNTNLKVCPSITLFSCRVTARWPVRSCLPPYLFLHILFRYIMIVVTHPHTSVSNGVLASISHDNLTLPPPPQLFAQKAWILIYFISIFEDMAIEVNIAQPRSNKIMSYCLNIGLKREHEGVIKNQTKSVTTCSEIISQ